ncbi:uncharacterized protein LOC127279594 [Leptopilina boulardi]|uniref:uncharacterized protein LOC127279594 n=1 Tax=Leptopilina boulardi TaxID=63433 RepID=UPI0021F5624E|nr:uncharacterized protein LOC127279594 [Leptopilina boulardi]
MQQSQYSKYQSILLRFRQVPKITHFFKIEALGSIGGRDLKNTVANICSKLFTNSVAKAYSWSGRKSGKDSLENTVFADLIIGSVKVTFLNETDVMIKDAGSKWMAQATTRFQRALAKESTETDDLVSEEETEDANLQDEADDEEEF